MSTYPSSFIHFRLETSLLSLHGHFGPVYLRMFLLKVMALVQKITNTKGHEVYEFNKEANYGLVFLLTFNKIPFLGWCQSAKLSEIETTISS